MGKRSQQQKAMKKAAAVAAKEAEDAALEAFINRPTHKIYGILQLTPKQRSLYSARNSLDPVARKNDYHVYVDPENTRRDIGVGVPFNYEVIGTKFENFLQHKFGKASVVKTMTVIGNRKVYLNGLLNQRRPSYLRTEDVYPRNAMCSNKNCPKKQFRVAIPHLRPARNYERPSDVADSKLLDAMSACIRKHGSPCNIVLVSADCDFATYLYSVSRHLGIKVFLAMPLECSNRLKYSVDQASRFDLAEVLAF